MLQDVDEENVYKLDSSPLIKVEGGCYLGQSMPSPLPQPLEHLDIHAVCYFPCSFLLSPVSHRKKEPQ